ncbi:MAG: aryl-sulfate sulfotransferase [Myxococcota bacterium]
MVAVSLVGCLGAYDGPPAPTDRAVEAPPDTGTQVAAGSVPTAFPAQCAVWASNALRVWCDASPPIAGPVTVTLTPADGEGRVRTFRSDASLPFHHVFGWGLTASTRYAWRIDDDVTGLSVAGELVTGPLPSGFELLDVEVERSGPAGIELLLVPLTCPPGTLALLDADGAVVWYEVPNQLADLAGSINATAFTDRRTIVVVVGRSTVLEFDLAGRLLMRSDRGDQFADFLHHDVYERDGLVYALHSILVSNDPDPDLVYDGVYVIDAAGTVIADISTVGWYPVVIAPWMTTEPYWDGPYEEADDFTHGNSVYVDPAGDLWLSFRHLHAFAKVDARLGSPTFGAPYFTVVGDDRSTLAPTFALSGSDPSFAGQHDVHLADDGTVLLLDNGFFDDAPTRGVRYALDEPAGVLTELDAWDVGGPCLHLGAIRELTSGDQAGDVVITCQSDRTVGEYPPGASAPVWELTATCAAIGPLVYPFPKAIPVAW